jgi:hypothetical protein
LRQRAPELAFGALAFVFLILHPVLNGYPFLFPDSWGYYGACPDEMRSPVLGCALKPVTAVFGPWGYAAAQCAAAAFALAFLWGRVLGRKHTPAAALALAASGFGLYAGFLMADAWTLTGLIGLFALAAGAATPAALGLLAFSAAAHLGNFPVYAATALWMLPFVRRRPRFLASAGLCLAAGLALVAGFNLLSGKLRLTGGNGGTFLASRILHDMPQVLEGLCAEKPEFELCARKTEVLAWSAQDHQSFTWIAYYNLGQSWEALARLSRPIVAAGLTGSPRLALEQAAAALGNTARLAFLPELSNGFEPFGPDSFAVADLRSCHPEDVDDFLGSWQSRGELERFLRAVEPPYFALTWIALAACLAGALAGWPNRRDDVLVQLAVFALGAAVANAFCMSFLSGVYGRYQARILFILFLPAAALLFRRAARRARKPA